MASASNLNQQKRDFADMFGGATRDVVNYSTPEGWTGPLLQLPDPADNLETTAACLEALAKVVEKGHSLAVVTGHPSAKAQSREPMTPAEKEQWDAWASGARMPDFDWKANRAPVPGSTGTAARLREQAEAMELVWDHEGATAENAAWLTKNMSYALPLLTGVSKVARAREGLVGGINGKELHDMDVAEVQTAHKAVAVAMENMNQVMTAMKRHCVRLTNARDVIQAREQTLKSKLPEYQKKDPVHQRPASTPANTSGRDETHVGADSNASKATRGKRQGRSNVPGGSGSNATH